MNGQRQEPGNPSSIIRALHVLKALQFISCLEEFIIHIRTGLFRPWIQLQRRAWSCAMNRTEILSLQIV